MQQPRIQHAQCIKVLPLQAIRTRFHGCPPIGAAQAYADCQPSSAMPMGSWDRGCSSAVPQLPSAAA